jgi:hypothetical protein
MTNSVNSKFDLILRTIAMYDNDVKEKIAIRWMGKDYPITVTKALPIRLWKWDVLLKGTCYESRELGIKYYIYQTEIRGRIRQDLCAIVN